MKNIFLDLFTYIDPVHGRCLRLSAVFLIIVICYIIAAIGDSLA